MWFIGVEEETSAPPPKILDPPLILDRASVHT